MRVTIAVWRVERRGKRSIGGATSLLGRRGERVGRRPSRRHRCLEKEREARSLFLERRGKRDRCFWEEEGSVIAVFGKEREARSLFGKGKEARSLFWGRRGKRDRSGKTIESNYF